MSGNMSWISSPYENDLVGEKTFTKNGIWEEGQRTQQMTSAHMQLLNKQIVSFHL